MINVGVIGSGFIAPRFLEASKEVGGYHIKAISSPHNFERLKELKEIYEIDYVTLNYKDILKDEEIDLIYIGSPNNTHYDYAKEILMVNKSVLCEKPFVSSEKEAIELVNLAKSKNLMIYEAIMTPTLPTYIKIKELLKNEQILKIDLNFSQYSHRYDDFKKGIIKPVFNKSMQGGALRDLNVYNIAFCIGLFGEPINVEYFPSIEREIDVGGKLILSYPQFEANLLAYKNKQGPTYIDIITSKGILHSDNPASTIDKFSYLGNSYKNEKSCYFEELKEFKRVYEEKDLHTLEVRNNETLLEAKILEKALKSAGLY